MKRALSAAVGAAAVAVLLSSCGTVQPDAARLNDWTFSDRDFRDELAYYGDNEQYRIADPTAFPNGTTGTASNEWARGRLFRSMLFSVLAAEVDERGLEATEAQVEEATANAQAEFSPDGTSAVWNGFPQGFKDHEIDRHTDLLLMQEALAGDTSDAALQARYEETSDQYQKLCVAHILLETEEEAKAVLAELEGGADFATVAEQRSIDPSAQNNGGTLNGPDGSCVPTNQLDADFVAGALAAEPGTPTQPVQTQFGWHIILVDEVQPMPFDEAKPSLLQAAQAEANAKLSELLRQALSGDDIWVNPKYGVWDPVEQAVQPPGWTAPTTVAPAP